MRDSAILLGQVLAPIIIVAGGFLLAKHLNRDRSYEDSVRWPIVLAFILVVLVILGQCSKGADSPNSSSNAENGLSVQVHEAQQAELWPSDLDEIAAAEQFEEFLVGELGNRLENANHFIGRDDLTSKSSVLKAKEKPIFHVAIEDGRTFFSHFFVGQVGNSQLTVECLQDDRPIDLDLGDCIERVRSTFGFEGEVGGIDG